MSVAALSPDVPVADAAASPAKALSEGKKLAIFGILAMGQVIALLDTQIVAGSLAHIQAGLNAGPDEIAWVQTAYLMAEIVMIPLAAYLARALSTRWLFVASAAMFTLASLLCGIAWDINSMIAFRVLQGFTGGAMIPTVFATGYALFEGKRLATMTAVLGMLSTLSPTLGPSVGGWITDVASWRWLFFVNVAPGLLIVCVLPQLGAVDRAEPRLLRRIDWVHVAAIAVMLGGFQYVLEEGPRHGWFSEPRVAIAAWLSFLGAGLFAERTICSSMPVVQLTPFRRPGFALACVLNLAIGVAVYSSVYLTPVFLSQVRNFTALQIGVVVLVSGLSNMVGAPVAVRLSGWFDARIVIAMGFGLLATFLWMYSAITPEWGYWQLFTPQILRGFGVLLCIIPAVAMALSGVPQQQLHSASGLFNLMRNLGGAIGIAVCNTLLIDFTRLHNARLSEGLGAAPAKAQAMLEGLSALAGRITPDPAHALALAQVQLGRVVAREAATQAFADVFRVMAWAFLAVLLIIPFSRRPAPAEVGEAAEHVAH